jgi:hypothetical protein
MRGYRRSVFGGGAKRRGAAAWTVPSAVLVLAFVLMVPASATASPAVANEPFTVFQWLSTDPIVATSIVVVQPYTAELTPEQISALHSENPNSKILRYVDSTEAIDTVSVLTDLYSWSLDYARRLNTDAEWNDLWTNHQSWFLKDSNGQYIHRPSSYTWEMDPKRPYLMDQGSAGWRDWLIAKVAQRLSYGYDGVFLDQCPPTPTGYSAIPAKYAGDYGLWRNDINGLINYIKSHFPNAVVISNSLWNGQAYYANASPNPIDANNEDGTEIEGFVYAGGNGPTESQANWLKEVTIVKKLGDDGKIALVHTCVNADDSNSPKRLLAYSLATFLLGKSGPRAYFDFVSFKSETGFSSDYLNAVYGMPIGDPTGVYYKKGIAYRRDFTNGKVIVNPNDTNQVYKFIPLSGNHYKDQNGNVYDAAHPLSLPAKAGVILMAIPAPVSTRYEQSDVHMVKKGVWTAFTKADASGGTYARSPTAGASATISFTGTRLDVIAMKGTTTGIVDVYLDNVLKATIDTAAAVASYKVVLWSTGDIEKGTHTVRIVRSDSSAVGKFLTLDAVDIWGAITASS